MKIRTLVACCVITFIFTCVVLAKETRVILPYRPNQNKDTGGIDKRIKEEIDVIKNSVFYNSLLKYKAVRNDDPDLCGDNSCRDEARKTLLPIRYMAETRCSEIKGNALKKEICQAIAKGDCNSLDEQWKKDYCRNFLEGNIAELESIAIANKLEQPKSAKTFILYDLGIYSGFKYYSPLPCERYIGRISAKDRALTLVDKLSCQILFSSDEDSIMKGILRDLAYFSLSRKENNMSLCDNVNNSRIKQTCSDPGIKKFDDAWEQSF